MDNFNSNFYEEMQIHIDDVIKRVKLEKIE